MYDNKETTLRYLKNKEINGLSFSRISSLTGYSISYLKKLKKLVEEKDIESLCNHNGIKNKNHSANDKEINFIVKFKEQYPEISISQFQDIYHEQVIFNKKKADIVKENNLKKRSYSFFQSLYKRFNWKSPFKHRIRGKKQYHTLRDPVPKTGMLVMVDGTPHDWFSNGKLFSLHLALDDATGRVLCGYFMPTECLKGYCHMLVLLITKYGIPENIYSDKHTIFKSPVNSNYTNFGKICKELGINQILANTPEAKGKIERINRTIQGRLLNDIKRYKIKTYTQLNDFFNSRYCKYLNHKFSYLPKDSNSAFVKVEKDFDINQFMCTRMNRKFLDGNVFSYMGYYYKIVDSDGVIVHLFRGTTVEVRENVFDSKITVKYNKTIYDTVVVGKKNKKDSVQTIIKDQKDLKDYFTKK